MLPIIQSLAQLEKNYGKEGSEIIQDNCQDTIFGGFAPNSQTADVLSRALGSYTVQSGSVSRSKGENSQSLQMAERALMTPDELKSIPKGEFVVMKTGSHPMRTRLRLFLVWGITFGEPYQMPENGQRAVYYAGREELEEAIKQRLLLGQAQSESHQESSKPKTSGYSSGSTQENKPMATMTKKPHGGTANDGG